MIPDCIKLEQRQIDRLTKWANTLSKKQLEASFEEDCSCASPFTFEVFGTGLGDVITVKSCGQKLDLTIGDDNEFVTN